MSFDVSAMAAGDPWSLKKRESAAGSLRDGGRVPEVEMQDIIWSSRSSIHSERKADMRDGMECDV